MTQIRQANDLLRRQRELRGWSQKRVAERLQDLGGGCDSKQISRWESGVAKPNRFYQELLISLFELTADKLGFIDASASSDKKEFLSTQISLQREQSELGTITMTKFDSSRRSFLGTVGTMGVLAAGLGGTGEYALQQYEKLNEVCWDLNNINQLEMADQILAVYLPKISAIAHHSSPYQPQAASLVARAHILAAETDKQDVAAMQMHAQRAVIYSQFTDDSSVQCDALRQEATIALVAKQPFKALQSYQKALPLVERVSPLLRSRMYLGLASAFARCNPVLYRQEALTALGHANEHFPADPEADPWYLYMHSSGSKSVLHLYEALTYNDLGQPKEAWNALMHVDGLHPKLHVTDSSRLEFLNLQAKTVSVLGHMDQSITYLEASVDGADATGYTIWREEAADVYQDLVKLWPHELRVRRLGALFKKGA